MSGYSFSKPIQAVFSFSDSFGRADGSGFQDPTNYCEITRPFTNNFPYLHLLGNTLEIFASSTNQGTVCGAFLKNAPLANSWEVTATWAGNATVYTVPIFSLAAPIALFNPLACTSALTDVLGFFYWSCSQDNVSPFSYRFSLGNNQSGLFSPQILIPAGSFGVGHTFGLRVLASGTGAFDPVTASGLVDGVVVKSHVGGINRKGKPGILEFGAGTLLPATPPESQFAAISSFSAVQLPPF